MIYYENLGISVQVPTKTIAKIILIQHIKITFKFPHFLDILPYYRVSIFRNKMYMACELIKPLVNPELIHNTYPYK